MKTNENRCLTHKAHTDKNKAISLREANLAIEKMKIKELLEDGSYEIKETKEGFSVYFTGKDNLDGLFILEVSQERLDEHADKLKRVLSDDEIVALAKDAIDYHLSLYEQARDERRHYINDKNLPLWKAKNILSELNRCDGKPSKTTSFTNLQITIDHANLEDVCNASIACVYDTFESLAYDMGFKIVY